MNAEVRLRPSAAVAGLPASGIDRQSRRAACVTRKNVAVAVAALIIAGCGGGGSSLPPVTISVTPTPSPAPAPSPAPSPAPTPTPMPSPAPTPTPAGGPASPTTSVDSIPAGTAFPSQAVDGQVFYNTAEERIYVYRAGAWIVNNVTVVVINHPPAPSQGTIAPSPVPTTIAINSGGPAFFTGSNPFLADQYHTGGETLVPPSVVPVADTAFDPVYQTERWGQFSYVIPLQEGTYEVTIHQAEVWDGISGPEQRVFDIVLEPGKPGEYWIRDIDIWSAVGPHAAYDIIRTVRATGGTLVVDFRKKIEDPKIAGISVRPVTSSSTNPKPVAAVVNEVVPGLRGAVMLTCTSNLAPNAGQSMIFEISDHGIRLGNTVLAIAGIRQAKVEAFGMLLTLNLTWRDANGEPATGSVQFSLSGTTLRMFGYSCNSNSQWSGYDGNPHGFVNRFPPAVSYRDVRLNCSFANPNGGYPFESGYRSVHRISYANRTLSIFDLGANAATNRSFQMMRDPGNPDYLIRSVLLDAERDLITYEVASNFRTPFQGAKLTVDAGGVIRTASISSFERITYNDSWSISCPTSSR